MRCALLIALSAAVAAAEPPAAAQPDAPPAPPEVAPLVPPEFHQLVIGWDAERHEAVKGRSHQPLTREQLFAELDRPDLLDRARALQRRRILLGVGSGLALAAGLVPGVVLLASAPNLNGSPCVDRVDFYNQCVSNQRTLRAGGTISIGLGVVVAALLATFAYWSDPGVVDDDEAQRLISRHNADLLKRLRPEAFLLRDGAVFGASATF